MEVVRSTITAAPLVRTAMAERTDVDEIRERATVVDDHASLAPLLDRLEQAEVVLIGEATHGTAEFYELRSWLTAHVLRANDRAFVAVEGDWAPCTHLDRYVRGRAPIATARAALEAITRWPTWLLANEEVCRFLEWLAAVNRGRRVPVGFHGIDVYGLFDTVDQLIDRLARIDEGAARQARALRSRLATGGGDADTVESTTSQLELPEADAFDRLDRAIHALGPVSPPGDRFDLEQHALVVRNAARFHAASGDPDRNDWNLRSHHMLTSLDRLRSFHGWDATAVVWAHNSHVGDARATDMADRGDVTLGQLVRDRYGPDAVSLVGFGTHRGSVIAAPAWAAPMQQMPVPPAVPGSIDELFHSADGFDRLMLSDRVDPGSGQSIDRPQRAIGVVYDPNREADNYVPTCLRARYDAYLHLDATNAVRPLAWSMSDVTSPTNWVLPPVDSYGSRPLPK